ncbi:9157_t:CDS:1, partial [Scutellospora calospora]
KKEDYGLDWLEEGGNKIEKEYLIEDLNEIQNLWPVTCLVSQEEEEFQPIPDIFDYYYENEVRLGVEYEIGELEENQKRQLGHLIDRNVNLGAQSIHELGRTNIIQHTIPTQKNLPIRQRSY